MELRNDQNQLMFQAISLDEKLLAAEGYKFYSQEAEEFAAVSAWAVADAFNLDDYPYATG